jgi:hypothetical protein
VFDLDTCFGLVGETNAQDENSRGSSNVVGDFPSFPLVLLVRLREREREREREYDEGAFSY